MTFKTKLAWTLGLTGLFFIPMLPSHAVIVLEGDNDYYSRPSSFVEIIEGDDIKQSPSRHVEKPVETSMAPPLPSLQPEDTRHFVKESSLAIIPSLITKYNRHLSESEVHQMTQAIHNVSDRYGLDPHLIASLVAVESSFRPAAISSSGAIGLGQLKPATAKWLGVADPYNPQQNIAGVGKYLRYLLDRYDGSVQHALAAYFQGQGTIDRQGINKSALYYIGKINQIFNKL